MERLTPREHQVCQGLLKGMRYQEIGVELGLRRSSVACLAKRVYRALGVTGRVGLLRYAILRGWVPGTDRGLHWTRREQQVLNLALRGNSQREIAACLGLSIKTLDLTLWAMRKYAGAETTAVLIRVAVEQVAGLV